MRVSTLSLIGAAILSAGPVAAAEAVSLIAAGSLRTALGQVVSDFEAVDGTIVETTFGPSGLMRQKIEADARAHVFASANMSHPQTLQEAGRGGPVVVFARNRLCGIAQPGLEVTSASLLEIMLAESTRLGTSTPGADPSGDYAWELFAKAENLTSGARQALEAKSVQLTGGPDSDPAPEGRNPYAWVMESDRADLFLTYCTNAVLAQREIPDLQIVHVPESLSVGADYGLIVLDGAPDAAWRLAFHILSPAGQSVLADYGFDAPGLPRE
ncbi:molybdate ABC transporter substrate-binding protein [Roseivivax halodurans JCM 10272]|uniref:Molybdate ABC transporter substrate-binding protein n=1 Tax=Roseivivax halodurans JCM 10272 TaxID=1449350 RepID=X7EKK9_9RHOB|nr:molybdate ABC transporter substrate-binding protein [Roseivivax halodurans]ETX16390.1 molybdate ABC transporter substrate-binding protein [Roseivivax halodurans JCM 10272]